MTSAYGFAGGAGSKFRGRADKCGLSRRSGGVFLAQVEERQRGLGSAATLVALLRVGADDGLLLVLDGEDPVADGIALHRQLHEPARAFLRDDLEVESLAA